MRQNSLKLIIRRTDFQVVGVAIFLFYAFFCDIVERKMGYSAIVAMIIASMICFMISIMTDNGLRISTRILRMGTGWIIMLVLMVLPRNRMLGHGSYMKTVRWIWALIVAYMIAVYTENYMKILKLIVFFSFVHVVVTLYFYLNPSGYQGMYKFWDEWPAGTESGKYGYKAGIAEHYSRNALYALFATVSTFSIYILKIDKRSASRILKNKFWLVLLVVAAFALMLTQKRAHTVFGVLALLVGYYYSKSYEIKARSVRILKILMLILAAGIAVKVMSQYSGMVRELLVRIRLIGQDKSSVTRDQMSDLAVRLFWTAPILGIGWGGYGYHYKKVFESTFTLDVHNVYIQMLCENGILGFGIFIATFVYSIYLGIKAIKLNTLSNNERIVITYALIIQVFVALYNITGNAIYDSTFCHYMIVLGMTQGLLTRHEATDPEEERIDLKSVI